MYVWGVIRYSLRMWHVVSGILGTSDLFAHTGSLLLWGEELLALLRRVTDVLNKPTEILLNNVFDDRGRYCMQNVFVFQQTDNAWNFGSA